MIRKHRLRFSLLSLLFIITACCLVFSIVGPHFRACARVSSLGGDIGGGAIVLSGTRASNRDLQVISALSRTEVIWLNGTNVDDSGLKYLEHMPHLRVVMLDNTATTGVGLRCLKSLPIEWLDIRDTLVGDDALGTLCELRELKKLNLRGSKVSEHAARQIKLCLPNCELDY